MRRSHFVVPLRSSPAVWAFPFVVALMVFCWASIESGGVFDPYLTGYLARAGIGLEYGLPIAAGAAAWASRRRYALSNPLRMRLENRGSARILLAHLWPLLIATLVGYLIVLIIEVLTMPPRGLPDLSLLATFAAMTVSAVSFGWIVGSILPVALAVPVSILIVVEWASYPLTDGSNVSWRNITGYATFLCCGYVDQGPDLRATLAPLATSIVLVVVAALTVRLRWRFLALPALAALALALIVANTVVGGTNATASALRSFSAQKCEGQAPRVCLYPEATSATRMLIEKTLGSAYKAAENAGIGLPAGVVAPSRENQSNGTSVVSVSFPSIATSDEILAIFAAQYYEQLSCRRPSSSPNGGLPESVVVPYALALTMGADPDAALPTLSYGSENPSSVDVPVTPAKTKEALGVRDRSDGVRLAKAWYEAQSGCGG